MEVHVYSFVRVTFTALCKLLFIVGVSLSAALCWVSRCLWSNFPLTIVSVINLGKLYVCTHVHKLIFLLLPPEGYNIIHGGQYYAVYQPRFVRIKVFSALDFWSFALMIRLLFSVTVFIIARSSTRGRRGMSSLLWAKQCPRKSGI